MNFVYVCMCMEKPRSSLAVAFRKAFYLGV